LVGYAGNNRLNHLDIETIAVTLSDREGKNAFIGMNEVQRLECTGTSGTFSLQLLNDTVDLDATMTPAAMAIKLNSDLDNIFEVSVDSSDGSICTGAGATSDITFTKPWGQGLPTMAVVKNLLAGDSVVTVSPVIEGIDSIEAVVDSLGLYKVMYTLLSRANTILM
jgi:hypothetical protein